MRVVLAVTIGLFALIAVVCVGAAIVSETSTGALQNGAWAVAFAVMTAFWVVVRREHRANGSLVATRRIAVTGVVAMAVVAGLMVVIARTA